MRLNERKTALIVEFPNGHTKGTRKQLYINEEGKLNDLPWNSKATTILKLHGLIPNDYIVGDVVILSNEEED